MGFNYIVLQTKTDGLVREVPIIYPDTLVHEHVALALQLVMSLYGNKPTVVSAGSIELSVGSCDGKSTSLGIKSRKNKDRILINNYPYMHGIT